VTQRKRNESEKRKMIRTVEVCKSMKKHFLLWNLMSIRRNEGAE
jgi:hypothetical protein